MINYRKGKERYIVNDLGSLYIDRDSIKDDKIIIYIGGQMEHRFHVFEQSGYTFDLLHNRYNGSWFYDYSNSRKDKYNIDALAFADNLVKSLEIANIDNVDIIADSHGGLVGAYATKSERINKVFAIHSPIYGSPLANPSSLKFYDLGYTKAEKMIEYLLRVIVNEDFGFQSDNQYGLNLDKVDLDKFVLVGSSIDKEKEKNKLALTLYDMILKSTDLENDGVVIFNEERMKHDGVKYIKELVAVNHFDAGIISNIERIEPLILQMK